MTASSPVPLAGEASPSGKLAETWPMKLEDTPSHANFGNDHRQVVYREGLNVGYRWYHAKNVTPHFCFGAGEGYTAKMHREAPRPVLPDELCSGMHQCSPAAHLRL